jgi:hypothetical protein
MIITILLNEVVGVKTEHSIARSKSDIEHLQLLSGCDLNNATETIDCRHLHAEYPLAMFYMSTYVRPS